MNEPDAPPVDLLPCDGTAVEVQVHVHDTSRFEWQVTLPLPQAGHLPYVVEAEFELPSNALSGHSPWDLLQGLTRLDGDLTPVGVTDGTMRSLRQRVVALARMLTRAREAFERHCHAVRDHTLSEDPAATQAFLQSWLEASLRTVAAAREQLTLVQPAAAQEQTKERSLADEYLSLRLLDFLADAQEVLGALHAKEAVAGPGVGETLRKVDEQLAVGLDAELAYRRRRGFVLADPALPETLEKYVERAGRLKKHFQEALSLDREAYPLDERVQQWVATFSALISGMFVFGAQLVLGHWSLGSRLSSGLAVVIVLTGITYAARDRLKEIGRSWITGKVYRFHAQRTVKCRLFEDTPAQGAVVVQAQEWCNETTIARPDPLNLEGGASMRTTVVHHLHRGKLHAHPKLAASGARRIRHVFRYDLSPLFSRLRDPVKRVPVVDVQARRARFIDAPRRYQLPIHIRVTVHGRKYRADSMLVVDKHGINRLEPCPEGDFLDLLPQR